MCWIKIDKQLIRKKKRIFIKSDLPFRSLTNGYG